MVHHDSKLYHIYPLILHIHQRAVIIVSHLFLKANKEKKSWKRESGHGTNSISDADKLSDAMFLWPKNFHKAWYFYENKTSIIYFIQKMLLFAIFRHKIRQSEGPIDIISFTLSRISCLNDAIKSILGILLIVTECFTWNVMN